MHYILLTYNSRKVLPFNLAEANRIARTMIHFGAVNVTITKLTFDEVMNLF